MFLYHFAVDASTLTMPSQYKNTNMISVEMKTTTEFRADDLQLERGDAPGAGVFGRKRWAILGKKRT